MNVDTTEFKIISARVEELETRLRLAEPDADLAYNAAWRRGFRVGWSGYAPPAPAPAPRRPGGRHRATHLTIIPGGLS